MIDYTPKQKKEPLRLFGAKYNSGRKVPSTRIDPVQSGYNPRETKQIGSLSTSGGSASLKESQQYTGTEMVGITIIHKSCLQPVFSQQSAIDAASMRR